MRGLLGGVIGTFTLAIACSSGGSGTGPASVTSIDSTKSAQSLSDGEADQYCKDLQNYVAAHMDEIKRFACAFGAAFASIAAKTDDEAKTLCRQTYNECLTKMNEATPQTSHTSVSQCPQFIGRLKTCPATIGDLNQCIVEQIQALGSINADTLCAEARAPSSSSSSGSASPAMSSLASPPAACANLQSSCPTLFQPPDPDTDSAREVGDPPPPQP